jgi:hypothetical protein
MPLIELTDDELRDAAMAARIAAMRAEQDAAAQANPRIKATFADGVARYATLGKKFEQARCARVR